MNCEFVLNRLTNIRCQKDISEARMSRELGHSKGYLHDIASGRRNLPLEEFFNILEYFDIKPAEFFAEDPSDMEREIQIRRINEYLRTLPLEVLEHLADAAEMRLKPGHGQNGAASEKNSRK